MIVTRTSVCKARLATVLRIGLAVMTLGCASYSGSAKPANPAAVTQEGTWWMVPGFPLVQQEQSSDCGAAALAAVLQFWGYPTTAKAVEASIGHEDRLRAADMVAYARGKGLRSYAFFGTLTDVVHEVRRGRPVIVGLGKAVAEKQALSHYEVVVGYEPQQKRVLLLDPGRGWQVDTLKGFGEEWARTKGVTIVAFLPDPQR